MSDHRPRPYTLCHIENADTRARPTTQPQDNAQPQEKTGSPTTPSTESTTSNEVSRLRTWPFDAPTPPATPRHARNPGRQPQGASQPPRASGHHLKSKEGARPRRASPPPLALDATTRAARAARPPRPLPGDARPPERRRERATMRHSDLAHHLPGSPPPPRSITAILITFIAATVGALAGSPWRGLDWPVNPGGPWRGPDKPASLLPSMLATPPSTRWGARLKNAARTRGQAPACPNECIGLRVKQFLIQSVSVAPSRADGKARHRRTKRKKRTTRVWFNSRAIKYIDHRLSWQVEGSAGNHA